MSGEPENLFVQKIALHWEDAVVGNPLADLAISRLDLLWIYSREEMEAFTWYYLAKTDIDTPSLAYWDIYAALRLARLAGADLRGWAAFFEPHGRGDITEQSICDFYRFFVEQALEKGFTAETQRKQRRGKKY